MPNRSKSIEWSLLRSYHTVLWSEGIASAYIIATVSFGNIRKDKPSNVKFSYGMLY